MTGKDVAVYRTDLLEFSYPSNWVCEAEDHADGVAILLQSSDVTFCIVGIYDDSIEPAELVDQAIDGLREEHPGIESEEVRAGQGMTRLGPCGRSAFFLFGRADLLLVSRLAHLPAGRCW